MIVFSVIAFGIAYLLYVFPVLALLSLFRSEIFSPWSLVPTALVFLLIRLYLATSITNRMLRAFVIYGMGAGFLSCLILIAFWWPDGLAVLMAVLGAIAVVAITAVTLVWCIMQQSCRRTFTGQDQRRRFAFISDVHIGPITIPSEDDLRLAAVPKSTGLQSTGC